MIVRNPEHVGEALARLSAGSNETVTLRIDHAATRRQVAHYAWAAEMWLEARGIHACTVLFVSAELNDDEVAAIEEMRTVGLRAVLS